MTSIDIPRDDIGTLDLKLKNADSAAVKPTSAVLPYPAISNENQIRAIIREQFGNKEQRRNKERRHGDRRHQQEAVLLDTRSHRDRRNQARRRSDDNHDSDNNNDRQPTVTIRKGVDTFV